MSEAAVPQPPRGVGVWVMAARPRTLAASVAPVVVGTALAGAARPMAALLCLLSQNRAARKKVSDNELA